MMPKLGGYEVCRRLESRKGIGILLLTAKNDIVDKVLGLELGADDFMSKPFDLRELLARIKALVRRLEREGAPAPEGTEMVLGPLRVRPSSRTAELGAIALDRPPRSLMCWRCWCLMPGGCIHGTSCWNRYGASIMWAERGRWIFISSACARSLSHIRRYCRPCMVSAIRQRK